MELGNGVSVVFEDEEVDEWAEGWPCEDDLPVKAFQKDAMSRSFFCSDCRR